MQAEVAFVVIFVIALVGFVAYKRANKVKYPPRSGGGSGNPENNFPQELE